MQRASKMKTAISKLPTMALIFACLTLGLAPFTPMPHLAEKIGMIIAGNPLKPIDYFDMAFHGLPWMLLVLKLYFLATPKT
jgi:hypothetical protein